MAESVRSFSRELESKMSHVQHSQVSASVRTRAQHKGNYRVAIIYGLGRTIETPVLKKSAAIYDRNMVFPQKVSFLIRKITKQDKETIEKRAKEVPESSPTVCRGDRSGAWT